MKDSQEGKPKHVQLYKRLPSSCVGSDTQGTQFPEYLLYTQGLSCVDRMEQKVAEMLMCGEPARSLERQTFSYMPWPVYCDLILHW